MTRSHLSRVVCLGLFFVLAVVPTAWSADLTDLIRQRYDRLSSFSADFEQTLTHKESGSTEKRRGKLLFRKPLLIHWQTAKPHEETLVVTSQEIWDYLPDEEIAYRYPPDLVKDSHSIIQVVTGQASLAKDFDVRHEGLENGLARLLLYPKEPTPQLVEACIWVSPESGYIRRARIVDFYGNSNDVSFVSFTPDANISARQFSFTPPDGIEVEDRMDRNIPERDLFK